MGAQDEDDWTGEPPEGRHTREQSNPGFWAQQWQASLALAVVGIAAILALLLILLA